MPLEQVFKTLVVRATAAAWCWPSWQGVTNWILKPRPLSGDRRTELVPLKEVQPLTGYIAAA